MSRPLRIIYPGAIYHVMNRGAARQAVFANSAEKELFLQVLADGHARWGVEILAYCLMGNHYHLCLRTPEGNLARVMRHVNGVYTQRVNRARGRDGPLFRGRYKALVVEASTYLTAVIRYIHLNPVQAKLVKTPEAYPWSSHATYLQAKAPPPWLAVKRGLAEFGRARDFHAYVLAGNDEALEAWYAADRHQPVLGGEQFRAGLTRKLGTISREHARHERVAVRPSVARVVQTVAKSYGVTAGSVRTGRGGSRGEVRQVAMYFVTRLCDWTLQATADYFGLTSYGGVSWACAQIREKQAKEETFRISLERMENHILQQQT